MCLLLSQLKKTFDPGPFFEVFIGKRAAIFIGPGEHESPGVIGVMRIVRTSQGASQAASSWSKNSF